MELVYLWVEEYKNIKNQGFNFSPRFTCKYDKDKNELTIDKKEHFNIFPPNINITAIVGENGSGKSTILESFLDALSQNNRTWLADEDYRAYIVVYQYEEKYYYLTSYMSVEINIIDKKGEKISWIEKNPNDKLLSWHSDLLTLLIENENKPKKIFRDYEQIVVEHVQVPNKNRIKKQIIVNTIFAAIYKRDSNKFFNPIQVSINVKWNNLFNQKEDSTKYDKAILDEIEVKTNKAKQNFIDNKYKDAFYDILNVCDIKQRKLKREIFSGYMSINDDYFTHYFHAKESYSCISKIVTDAPIQDIYKKVIDSLDSFKNMTFEIKDLTENIIDFIFDLPDYIFDVTLSDNDKSFEDLSFGERQLLTELNFIQFYANKKKFIPYDAVEVHDDGEGNEAEVDITIEQPINNMLVLIDEFEIGLHPEWQRKAINYIVDFLSPVRHINFHLLITSHSSFILSDLPKENVIFLENGKQVDPNIETFGANIHTLLSHGFFMKDGLMGEFAKSKINEVIDYLNHKNSPIADDDEAQRYIHIIGEPIVKRQLQRMLDSKKLDKVKEIDTLKNQIESLQNRLENLEKKS
jgi:predicted ATP-binding protein involved in virulence